MMLPEAFLGTIIDPGIHFLHALGGPAPSQAIRLNLLAIALQESGPSLNARYQHSPSQTPGPARGFWQFEQSGGVRGVLTHSASASLARRLCEACSVIAQEQAVWRALEGHDLLATGFARLLIWTDPYAVPTTENPAWEMYNDRLWRPGKPHRDAWNTNWATAEDALQEVA